MTSKLRPLAPALRKPARLQRKSQDLDLTEAKAIMHDVRDMLFVIVGSAASIQSTVGPYEAVVLGRILAATTRASRQAQALFEIILAAGAPPEIDNGAPARSQGALGSGAPLRMLPLPDTATAAIR